MLYRKAFHLSDKVVALHLDNCIANAYLCNQSGRVSICLSRLACHILNFVEKYGITLIPGCIPTHLNVETDYLSWVRLDLRVTSSSHSSASVSTVGSMGGIC